MSDDPIKDALTAFIDERIATAIAKLAKPANDEYLTTSAAAVIARVTPGTIRRWVRNKRITKHAAGGRVRISRAELERYLSGAPANESPSDKARRRFG